MLEKPRLATMEDDYWELRSGEKSHEENPDTFWIPEKPSEKYRWGHEFERLADFPLADESKIPQEQT